MIKWFYNGNKLSQITDNYLTEIKLLLKNKSNKKLAIIQCCDCGLSFLTAACNKNRTNIRCPFGCRQNQKRECANIRSKKHYQEKGKSLKKELNKKRYSKDKSHTQKSIDINNKISITDKILGEHIFLIVNAYSKVLLNTNEKNIILTYLAAKQRRRILAFWIYQYKIFSNKKKL